MSSQNQNFIVDVYFKVIRTCDFIMYPVDIRWTITQFIQIMREKVNIDFGLENVEFVDTVSHELLPGNDSEDAPAIEPDSFNTIHDIYGNKLFSMCIYIRPIQHIEILLMSDNEESSPSISIITSNLFNERLCVICLSNERNVVFIPCNHMCTCIDCGSIQSIQTCPICRSNIQDKLCIFV